MPSLPRLIGLILSLVVVTGCRSHQSVQRIEMPGAVRSGETAGPATPAERWPDLSDRALQALWELYPGRASALGVHRYDRQLARRSGKQLKAQVDNLTRAVQNLYAIPGDVLTVDERVDQQLLIAQLRLAIHEIAVEGRPLLAPTDDVDELLLSLLAVWLDGSRPLEQRLDVLAARLLEVPVLLASTRDNLHQPSRRLCQAASADAAALMRFLDRDLRALGEHSEVGLGERLGLGIDEAVRGLARFQGGLDGRCAGGPDLVPVGAQNFSRRLSYAHGLTLEAEAVEAQARLWLQRAQQELSGLPPSTPPSLPAPPSFTRRALLDAIATQARTLRGLCEERGLVSLGSAGEALRAIETPPLLRGRVDALQLWPPPAFGPAEPLLLVDLLPPGEWTAPQRDALYGALGHGSLMLATARETYPGRILRAQLARRQVSAVRRAQDSEMLDQGWALYAMRLALDAGLVVGDAAATRARWQAVREAAARALADVSLQTGALDFEQAVQLLEREDLGAGLAAAARRALLEFEVLQLLRHPARASAGVLGLAAVERMRERAEAHRGASFDLRLFHDALLGQGSIPPPYIAHALFADPMPTLEPFSPPEAPASVPATPAVDGAAR